MGVEEGTGRVEKVEDLRSLHMHSYISPFIFNYLVTGRVVQVAQGGGRSKMRAISHGCFRAPGLVRRGGGLVFEITRGTGQPLSEHDRPPGAPSQPQSAKGLRPPKNSPPATYPAGPPPTAPSAAHSRLNQVFLPVACFAAIACFFFCMALLALVCF